MNIPRLIMLLALAFLGVFVEATWDLPRRVLGAQLDVLPALVVYAAVSTDLASLALLTAAAGLWLDSVSASPLGSSILPLFVTGLVLQRRRELLLREMTYAQIVLGLGATAAVTLLKLAVLLTLGEHPILGWESLWQLAVVVAGGAVLTPVVFASMDGLTRAFAYAPERGPAFRPDREMKRGRT